MKNITKFFCIVCFTLFCSGCGNGFVPVGGKVTFEDGSPLTKGGISFSTQTYMADGVIQPDGSYVLTSLKPGDGLPPGNYKVIIGAADVDEKERTVYLVDPIFSDVTKTPLTAEVTPNQKTFDFKVTKTKK
jgi:hypothetical protein